MRFGSAVIPECLFHLARESMRAKTSFTPEDLRRELMERGREDLARLSSHATNQRIIANRVTRAVIKELAAAGELGQLKRGVWMKAAVLGA